MITGILESTLILIPVSVEMTESTSLTHLKSRLKRLQTLSISTTGIPESTLSLIAGGVVKRRSRFRTVIVFFPLKHKRKTLLFCFFLENNNGLLIRRCFLCFFYAVINYR